MSTQGYPREVGVATASVSDHSYCVGSKAVVLVAGEDDMVNHGDAEDLPGLVQRLGRVDIVVGGGNRGQDAGRRRSSPSSSMLSSTRHAVAVEATLPNKSDCSRSNARSEMQSPPSESITARSRSTWPGSWPAVRRRVGAIAVYSASLSPSLSDS